MARKGRTSSRGRRSSSSSFDLSTPEGLAAYAKTKGLAKDVENILGQKPRLSMLQRLSAGLGAFNTANAVATGIEKRNIGSGLLQYGKDIVRGVGSAITGTDYQKERKYYSDIAEEAGIENKIARFGLGFVGDILLDPTTYFGGAIAKGLLKGTQLTTNVGLRTIGKVAPELEQGLRLVGEGTKNAFGRAFVAGFKSSEGALDDVLTFMSKRDKARLGLAASNLDRLGTNVLTKSQQEELALKLIAAKRAEFDAREAGKIVGEVDPLLTEARKYKSAEEFVSQFEYHGSKTSNPLQTNGIFTTPDINVAKNYGGEISLVSTKGKRIWDATTDEGNDALIKFLKGANPEEQVKRLKNAGYDGIKAEILDGSGGKNIETQFFDEQPIFTKSQLTDIWKKAQPANGIRVDTSKSFKDLVAEEVAKGADIVTATKTVQNMRSSKFGGQLGLENPYENYFPFLKKEKLDTFLKEVQTKGLRVGSEGYRKEFKNLLSNDNIELDPVKAFFNVEARQVSDKVTRDFLSGFAKKYGKTLSEITEEEALSQGLKPLKEKGIFGKTVGYVNEDDYRLISNLISPEFQTINMLAKATGFDALTSLFKRSVTGLFAPFHVRNFASGVIQNFEVLGVDALNPKAIAAGQKMAYLIGKGAKAPEGVLTVAGKNIKMSQVYKAFEERFGTDTFYHTDFLEAIDTGALKQSQKLLGKESLKETAKTLGLGQEAIPFRVGRTIGQYIEHQQKATAYLVALSQGKSIPEALTLATRAGFDYRSLTAFESQILRRIIPFYSFTRKNIELQLRTLGENPQRINQVMKFFNNWGDPIPPEESENLPDYIKNSLGIKLEDQPDGLKTYISSFGTPVEAFTGLFQKNPVLLALSMTNPILKTPIEIGIGKDSFRQQDLKDVYNAGEYSAAPKFIKDLLDIKEVQKPILRAGADGKLKQIGERTQYVADPVRLLIARSLFTSRGATYIDTMFDGDISGLPKLLKLTTGLKPQAVDIEMFKGLKERDQERALEDMLQKLGYISIYRNAYVPK